MKPGILTFIIATAVMGLQPTPAHGVITWDLSKPLAPPCNPSVAGGVHPSFRACDTGGDFLFNTMNTLLYDRTKKIVEGYYNQEVISFVADSDPKDFGGPVCDLSSGEGGTADDVKNYQGKSCGSFCNIENRDYQVWVDSTCPFTDYGLCGGHDCKDPANPTADTCTPNTCMQPCRQQATQKHLFTEMSTCDRELSYVRGAWVRNVSEMWLKVMNELKANRSVRIPSSSAKAQAYSGASTADTTAPCKVMAENFVKSENRYMGSRAFSYAPWSGIKPADCDNAATGGKALAACHIKLARQALENFYGYVMACAQFTYAMSDQLDFMITGASDTVATQQINGNPPGSAPSSDALAAEQKVTLTKTIFNDIMKQLKDECKWWLDNDIDIDDEGAAEGLIRECYRRGAWSGGLGREVGNFTKMMAARVATGGTWPGYGWTGSNCYYCNRFPITKVANYY
ncbi:MAG: hypothetical protein HY075_13945 [Deltaproteobacteria bacterium]|nr:hypothetical protein [Deltaproteobacteria bacterium]